MGQPVVHFELWSDDPAGVSAFYEAIFDWKVTEYAGTPYRMVDTGGGGINGGITKPQTGPWPANLTFYIEVDDIDAYLQKIEAAGGKVLLPKTEVPNMGWLALFADPDGRPIGLWHTQTAEG